MKIADLKKIGDNLGRFANIRETAKEPTDRLIIQADGETLKVVAGASFGTMIATAHATEQTFRAIVPAREFLTTIKGLPAKREVMLIDLNRGFAIGCSLVDTHTGEVYADFLRLTKSLPKVLLPPKIDAQSQGTVQVKGADLDAMGRIFGAITDTWMPNVGVYGKIVTGNDTVEFSGWDGYRWANHVVGPADYEIFGAINAQWLNAVRGAGDGVLEFWTDGKVTFANETFRAVGEYVMLNRGKTHSSIEFNLPEPEIKTVVDRLAFKKDIQDIQQLDRYGRVVLEYIQNALKVKPFDATSNGWRVTGEKLTKILTALSTKQVGIGLRTPDLPINVRIPEWEVEIAPVKLSKAS